MPGAACRQHERDEQELREWSRDVGAARVRQALADLAGLSGRSAPAELRRLLQRVACERAERQNVTTFEAFTAVAEAARLLAVRHSVLREATFNAAVEQVERVLSADDELPEALREEALRRARDAAADAVRERLRSALPAALAGPDPDAVTDAIKQVAAAAGARAVSATLLGLIVVDLARDDAAGQDLLERAWQDAAAVRRQWQEWFPGAERVRPVLLQADESSPVRVVAPRLRRLAARRLEQAHPIGSWRQAQQLLKAEVRRVCLPLGLSQPSSRSAQQLAVLLLTDTSAEMDAAVVQLHNRPGCEQPDTLACVRVGPARLSGGWRQVFETARSHRGHGDDVWLPPVTGWLFGAAAPFYAAALTLPDAETVGPHPIVWERTVDAGAATDELLERFGHHLLSAEQDGTPFPADARTVRTWLRNASRMVMLTVRGTRPRLEASRYDELNDPVELLAAPPLLPTDPIRTEEALRVLQQHPGTGLWPALKDWDGGGILSPEGPGTSWDRLLADAPARLLRQYANQLALHRAQDVERHWLTEEQRGPGAELRGLYAAAEFLDWVALRLAAGDALPDDGKWAALYRWAEQEKNVQVPLGDDTATRQRRSRALRRRFGLVQQALSGTLAVRIAAHRLSNPSGEPDVTEEGKR